MNPSKRLVIVHFFHIIFVGSLFLYLGLKKNGCPAWVYPALIFLGAGIIIAHGSKLFTNPYSIISWFHIIIVAPLVIFIGYNKPSKDSVAYILILLEGFMAIGYHSYALYNHF